jgi:hypothetical protein
MVRCVAVALIASLLAAPVASAAPPAPGLRESIAKVRWTGEGSSPPALKSPRTSGSRRGRPNGAVVAGLATLGLFGGMFVASRTALPCGCDNPETVVARGGLVGAIAGAIAGVVITTR